MPALFSPESMCFCWFPSYSPPVCNSLPNQGTERRVLSELLNTISVYDRGLPGGAHRRYPYHAWPAQSPRCRKDRRGRERKDFRAVLNKKITADKKSTVTHWQLCVNVLQYKCRVTVKSGWCLIVLVKNYDNRHFAEWRLSLFALKILIEIVITPRWNVKVIGICITSFRKCTPTAFRANPAFILQSYYK